MRTIFSNIVCISLIYFTISCGSNIIPYPIIIYFITNGYCFSIIPRLVTIR